MGVLAEIEVDLHVVQRRVEVVDGCQTKYERKGWWSAEALLRGFVRRAMQLSE
jgi:hypothetical protein